MSLNENTISCTLKSLPTQRASLEDLRASQASSKTAPFVAYTQGLDTGHLTDLARLGELAEVREDVLRGFRVSQVRMSAVSL